MVVATGVAPRRSGIAGENHAKVIDYIEGDKTVWEREPMEQLAKDGQLSTYLHHGFWQPVDTLRDKNQLEALWASGQAPWRLWS